MTSTDPTRRSKFFCHTSTTTRTAIMQTGSCKPSLNSCKVLWIFVYRRLVKRHGLASQTRGRNLRFVCERTAKFFNRIPLLALVHNRTRQNDGRISLQKQTSNDKRQSNFTKRGITMSFVSEKDSSVRF